MSKKPPRDVIRPSVVDGIEEYDNPLPSWWVGLFNFTIVYGIGYLVWFHVLNKSSLNEDLIKDRQTYQELVATNQQEGAGTTKGPEELAAKLKDPNSIAEGKGIFAVNCAACHGQLGEGTVGPNLTDKFWIHGGSPAKIVESISAGIPAKGMIAWGPIIGPQKIEAAAAYVLSLQGTQPANGKAPQGEEY